MARKILLADDSVTIQKVVELTFSEGDYQVLCVSDGAQVVESVRTMRPDLVLLDVILPGENGYDVCDAIKKDAALASIPVLLLTGTFEPFDRGRAASVGADGHVTKPFESQVLISRVTELLERGQHPPAPQKPGTVGLASPGGDSSPVPAGAVEPVGPRTPSPPAAATKLSDDDVDRIARRVAEQIGERVIREVAWDVVPDLAEQLVQKRIRQIEEEAD